MHRKLSFTKKKENNMPPPPKSNHPIKALASLLVAAAGDNYDNCDNNNDDYGNYGDYEYEGDITGDEIVRSGIARGKP
jgi:hypothetical protein